MKKHVCLVGIMGAGLPLLLCAQPQRSTGLWEVPLPLDTARSPAAAEPGVLQSSRFTMLQDAAGAGSIGWEVPELAEVGSGRVDGTPSEVVRLESAPGEASFVPAVGGAEVPTDKARNDIRSQGARRMAMADGGKAGEDLTWPQGQQNLASVLMYVKGPDPVTQRAAEPGATKPAVQRSAPDAKPASLAHPLIESHGSKLLGVLYLAEGSQPHPTAILFHGFPGFEQNLDLAQALRRAGWNVLAMHYRGSWGVKGAFSFRNCVEDADAQVAYLVANAASLRVDPKKMVVIGHSMGGFVAAAAAAHAPEVRAAILISAWNIGAPRSDEGAEAKALASGENLAPISGADGTTLAHEEFTHRAELDLQDLVPSLASRPVLLITADDHSDQFAAPFSASLESAGNRQVKTIHFQTDHPYSNKRVELTDAVLAFLERI